MSEMVERVAKAICRAQTQGEEVWQAFLPEARAAIGAMRDPTPAMKAAGAKRIPEAGYDLAHDAWCTMIDAALTTSPST
jgi:hypothetical protein